MAAKSNCPGVSRHLSFPQQDHGEYQVFTTEGRWRRDCIHDYIQSLPDHYQTVVGDRGVRLSGGQKQRISIARSILREPRILILDEATAFLDASVEEQLKETIRLLMQGKTIIVISHRLSTIQGVDKIIALEKEGIVYEGPSAEFFQNLGNGSQSISKPSRLLSSTHAPLPIN